MANVQEVGRLLNLMPLNFVDKKTGQVVQGYTLTLVRDAAGNQYEGFGKLAYKLTRIGEDAYAAFPQIWEQCKGWVDKMVSVECEMERRGKDWKMTPKSVALYQSSPLQKVA